MQNTVGCTNYPQHTYNNPEESLPTVRESVEPVPVVQIMIHSRLDVSRAISEEELMAGMRTRLKAIFE